MGEDHQEECEGTEFEKARGLCGVVLVYEFKGLMERGIKVIYQFVDTTIKRRDLRWVIHNLFWQRTTGHFGNIQPLTLMAASSSESSRAPP